MGIGVLILGASGAGKSASIRNCNPEQFGIINVQGKPLPFRNSFKTYNTDNYFDIIPALQKAKTPSVIIDDAQYLMVNELMRRALEKGYDKYSQIAQNYWDLVNTIKDLPPERVVYLLQHTERTDDGYEKAKTVGKMIDQYMVVEGYFSIVLKTAVIDGRHVFMTQTAGHDTVKAPIGMFPEAVMDNDLAAVDGIIREYYGISAPEKGDKKK